MDTRVLIFSQVFCTHVATLFLQVSFAFQCLKLYTTTLKAETDLGMISIVFSLPSDLSNFSTILACRYSHSLQ